MGLYIPPSSGNGSNDNGDEGSSARPEDVIFKFYQRPSVGLKIWGPLVPASDFRPGLYALTSFQALIGFVMFKNVRAIWHNKTLFARVSKTLSTVAGAYLIFNSGLEVSRLTLPYDPWFDEAKQARLSAVAKGEKPNFWFGPLNFKPMSFQEWSQKVDEWILDTETALSNGKPNYYDDGSKKVHNKFVLSSPEFHQVYLQIKQANEQRHSQVLQQLQNDSFKDILPNYQTSYNPRFDRPKLNIPDDNELKDDFDLEEAWELNNPWQSLGIDTDYIVRFIPRFRWITSLDENRKNFEEQQRSLKTQNNAGLVV